MFGSIISYGDVAYGYIDALILKLGDSILWVSKIHHHNKAVELEVIVIKPDDARAAEAGGATRLEVVGDMACDGLSPTPEQVAKIQSATSLPLRIMLRLRDGFSTDGAEMTRLKGLATAYQELEVSGLVLGFLNPFGEIDFETVGELLEYVGVPWTFHRAIDAALDVNKAWKAVTQLSCDQILTAGSARGVGNGLDVLLERAKDLENRDRILVGGGLQPEHIPWLVKAGLTRFHVGSSVRPVGSFGNFVDEKLVKGWVRLIRQELRRVS